MKKEAHIRCFMGRVQRLKIEILNKANQSHINIPKLPFKLTFARLTFSNKVKGILKQYQN